MKIELQEIKVSEVFDGYKDLDDDGVYGYHGKLDIRPAYQRNFVYDKAQQEEVIKTVLKGYPLNIMYWVKTGPDHYEVLDGQQRTLSLMTYLDHKFDIPWRDARAYWDGLQDDDYKNLVNYKLMVYICDGTDTEKLAWFKIVNIAGEELTLQELRNISYTGPWLADAKRHFSKRGCAAYNSGGKYVTGDPNRQELLEKALKWISSSQGIDIDAYMSLHKTDNDANELWQYWQDLVNWIDKIFPNYNSNMKGLDWGTLYNKYSCNKYNSSTMKAEVDRLMEDGDVTHRSGIYQYLLARDYEPGASRYLSIRAFDERDKKAVYQMQGGICPYCQKEGGKNASHVWKYEEMQGDHIVPWSKGGHTERNNLQMLCAAHNKQYGNIG